jgi:hypothetical protein
MCSSPLNHHFDQQYCVRLRSSELFHTDAVRLNMSVAPEIQEAESWLINELGSEQHGLHDLECLMPSATERSIGSSRFGVPTDGISIVSFTPTQATETSDYSIADTASDASFTCHSTQAITNPMPLTLDSPTGNMALASPSHKASLVAQTITPQPAILPQRRPKQPRSTCKSCNRTFSRPSDLIRHQQDIHEIGSFIYKCKVCKHAKFGRRDKVKEHCKSQKHGEVLVVEVASNPEVAFAVHSSRRRQNVSPPVGDT